MLYALPDSVEVGFRPVACYRSHPRRALMMRALRATLLEIRMAGVRAAVLKPEAFTSKANQVELVALLDRHEALLAQHHRAAMATVYEEAGRCLD